MLLPERRGGSPRFALMYKAEDLFTLSRTSGTAS